MQRLGELETSSCMGNNLTAFPEQESNSMPYPNMSISSAGYVSVCSPVSEESVASYQVASNLSSEPTSILNYTPLDSWPLVPTYISRRLGQLPSYALQSTQQSCCANPVAEAIFSEADVSKAAVTVGIPEAQSVITKQFLDEQTAENEVTNTSITGEKGEAISATSMLESCNGLLANHDYQHGSEIWMPDDFASFDTNPCVLPDFDPADVWVGMEMEHEDVFLESIIPKSYPSLYPFPIRACSWKSKLREVPAPTVHERDSKKEDKQRFIARCFQNGGGSLSIFNLMVVKKKFQKKHKIGFEVHAWFLIDCQKRPKIKSNFIACSNWSKFLYGREKKEGGKHCIAYYCTVHIEIENRLRLYA